MKVFIDASNISHHGGGLLYLKLLLTSANPSDQGIEKVYISASTKTLLQLPKKKWLVLCEHKLLNGSYMKRIFWLLFILPDLMKKLKCDILFLPGGYYLGNFRPFVIISHNLLPFENGERQRYGISFQRLRNEIFRYIQKKTFINASGLIFSSRIAYNIINAQVDLTKPKIAFIKSIIEKDLFINPAHKGTVVNSEKAKPFNWLYVSTVEVYKHQWNVVEAVAQINKQGYKATLTLIGGAYKPALKRLKKAMKKWDPKNEYIKYLGRTSDKVKMDKYRSADGFVFASSCDNNSAIIFESMAAGLPIACSDRSAMSEVLGDAAVYFNPEIVKSIMDAMLIIQNDTQKRKIISQKAYDNAKQYSNENFAKETMQFISEVKSKFE